jgi:hypothetical protein
VELPLRTTPPHRCALATLVPDEPVRNGPRWCLPKPVGDLVDLNLPHPERRWRLGPHAQRCEQPNNNLPSPLCIRWVGVLPSLEGETESSSGLTQLNAYVRADSTIKDCVLVQTRDEMFDAQNSCEGCVTLVISEHDVGL